MFEQLKELGLTKDEIALYTTCLAHDLISVKALSQKTGLIRTTVYGLVEQLISRGFLSKVTDEKIVKLRATPPRRLLELLEQRKKSFAGMLPELEKLSVSKPEQFKIESYHGRESVRVITNDLLTVPGQIILCIGAGKNWIEFSSAFTAVYYRRKKELKIKTKTILSDVALERQFIKDSRVSNSEIRLLKMDLTTTALFVYGSKVAFITYAGTEPYGFIIESNVFAHTQTVLFETAWGLARKV